MCGNLRGHRILINNFNSNEINIFKSGDSWRVSKMQIKAINFSKIALVSIMLLGLVACRSSGEEEPAPVAVTPPAPAAPAPAPAGPTPEQQRMEAALRTRIFYFDFDVAEFRPADRETLTYHARNLAANPNRRIRLEGHADERGTREYNLALGERRANGIANFLIVNGASRAQIENVSYGEERPAQSGTTEAAYQANRRVEVIDR
jgi:peptidoglycan-associated lipoprotein